MCVVVCVCAIRKKGIYIAFRDLLLGTCGVLCLKPAMASVESKTKADELCTEKISLATVVG